MRAFSIFAFLLSFTAIVFLKADEPAGETAAPIPIWERPDYVLETPDVIEIKIVSDKIPSEELFGINGTHLIGSDGCVHLGLKPKRSDRLDADFEKMERLCIGEMTVVQCENAVFELLSQTYDPEFFEVRVKVFSCNSKEIHVVYMSENYGEQVIPFPFTGHETVTAAVEACNGLPSGSSKNFLVLRAGKKGKPIEMIRVNYDEAVQDAQKDIALKPGDTVLIRQDFKGEDIRPDGPIVQDDLAADDLMVSEEDYEIPPFEIGEVQAKTASRVAVKPQAEKHVGKRIARTVFFDGDKFSTEENILHLTPLIKNIEPESSVSCMFQAGDTEGGRAGGFWLILFGDEETVTELQAVFKEIAEGK